MSAGEQADFGEIARRARQLQGEMPGIQSGLKALQATGVSGGGLVTATVSSEGRLVRLEIDSSVIDPGDPQTLAELVIAAVDGAHAAMTEQFSERMAPVASSLQDILAQLHQRPAAGGQVTPQAAPRRKNTSPRGRASRPDGQGKGATGRD
jgi:nucleoid-associated protein EbfC